MKHDLLHAIYSRNAERAMSLMKEGADVTTADKRGWTPLARAVQKNLPDVVNLLIDFGADVNVRDRQGRRPLYWAARDGRIEVMQRLLDEGAAVDAVDCQRGTALFQAITFGRTKTVELLLEDKGWNDRFAKSSQWHEGLHLAILHRRLRIVDLFLQRDIKTTSYYNWTSLMMAAAQGDQGILELMIRRGIDVNEKTGRRSALTEAISNFGISAPITGMLRAAGAYLGLEEAIVGNDLMVAELLIVEGADVEAPDKDGESLMTWAAFNKRSDAVRLLARHGARLDPSDRRGRTPLMGAAASGDQKLVEYLIERGATLDGVDAWRISLLGHAARSGSRDLVKWLTHCYGLGTDEGTSALFIAAYHGNDGVLRLLIQAGVNINLENHLSFMCGRTPLMIASSLSHHRVMGLLIEAGADLNAKHKWGETAFTFAALVDRTKSMKILLDAGATVDSSDRRFQGALRWAETKGN